MTKLTKTKNPYNIAFLNLTEQSRLEREQPQLAQRLKAEAPASELASEANAWRILQAIHGKDATIKAAEAIAASHRQQSKNRYS